MNTQNSTTDATTTDSLMFKAKTFFKKPSVKIASYVFGVIAAGATGAVVGHKMGKTTGRKMGQVEGYGNALNEIGVSPAEVPTMAAAWHESKAQAAEAMNDAAMTAAA